MASFCDRFLFLFGLRVAASDKTVLRKTKPFFIESLVRDNVFELAFFSYRSASSGVVVCHARQRVSKSGGTSSGETVSELSIPKLQYSWPDRTGWIRLSIHRFDLPEVLGLRYQTVSFG